MRQLLRFAIAACLLAWGGAAQAQDCSTICLSPILPPATTNTNYSASLAGGTSGGVAPYRYSSAVLPGGLGMDSTGLITGIPTTATNGYFSGSVTVTDSSAPPQVATGLVFYIQVLAQPLTITTLTLPHGVFGSTYSQPIQVSGGTSPYSFSVSSGSLSGTGLNLDPNTGILSGSPTSPGPLSFTVEVTDHQNAHVFESFTLHIDSNISLTIPAAAETALGTPVAVTLSASGGLPPYVWTPLGQLPPGVTLSSAGTLSGTPSQAGAFPIGVRVTDAQAFSATGTAGMNVFGITSSGPLPAGTTVTTYYATFNAVGGTPPYSFSATGLPAGLSLAHFGNLSGLVAQPGTYNFSVQVTDGTGLTVSSSFSLTINIPPPLSMTAPALASGTVQVPYSVSVSHSASGGNPPYNWTILNGSPAPGIALSATGILAGTPTAAGTFTFTLQATDGSGASGSVSATLVINPAALSITTQSPLTSGIMNAGYPQQVLTAAGGVAPYTFAITGGSLPAGLNLTDGVIGGQPTATGNFSVTIQVQDSTGTKAQATLAVNIRPATTGLVLSTGALSFALSTGSDSLPASQNVLIVSSDVNQTLGFSYQISSGTDWLTVSTGATTPSALVVGLNNQALNDTAVPATYSATISLTCTSSSCPAATAQTVTVTLAVTAANAVLTPVTDLLSFSSASVAAAASTQAITVQNTGGGILTFTSIACNATWCSVGSTPAPLSGGSSAGIPITADPTGLPAGFYRATVDILSSGGPASIPITLLVAQSSQILLAPSGGQLDMQVGGTPGDSNGSFLVGVSGNATLNWTASVVSGNGWLILNTPSGAASGSAPGMVSYSINPSVAALPAQPQYGLIQVTAPNSIDSPQYFELVLNISAQSAALTPDPAPAGLLFLTESGAPPPPQTVQVFVAGSAGSAGFQTGFQAAAATTDGAPWLSVTPATGTTSSSTPAQVDVTVDPSSLAPGIYHGGVSFSFTSAAAPTVNVTLIVENPVAGPAITAIHQSAVSRTSSPVKCTPSALAPTQTGLVDNFATPASWPTPLAILLVDDCGNAVPSGQVVATFTNGDPPLALSPANSSTGLYSGTWTPRSTGPQVSINALASAAGFPSAHLQITGQVIPNRAPVLTPNGTLHVFNPQVGAPLAPGTIVQVYGSGLALAGTVATTIPLPTSIERHHPAHRRDSRAALLRGSGPDQCADSLSNSLQTASIR